MYIGGDSSNLFLLVLNFAMFVLLGQISNFRCKFSVSNFFLLVVILHWSKANIIDIVDRYQTLLLLSFFFDTGQLSSYMNSQLQFVLFC